MKIILRNAMKNNAGNNEGWLGGGYCRECGMPVTAFKMAGAHRSGCVHSPATQETEDKARARAGRHRPERAAGEAAIWNEY
jgi:hypothetical protein